MQLAGVKVSARVKAIAGTGLPLGTGAGACVARCEVGRFWWGLGLSSRAKVIWLAQAEPPPTLAGIMWLMIQFAERSPQAPFSLSRS